jgi:flagellar motility protein MotE (MotC chaperone)
MRRAAAIGALLGVTLLAAAGATHAQSQPEERAKARAEAGREQFREAQRVCRYVPHAEQRGCMAKELCRENRDPARCEERYMINAERRDKVLEACKGKQGKVLQECMRAEYKKLGPAPKP